MIHNVRPIAAVQLLCRCDEALSLIQTQLSGM